MTVAQVVHSEDLADSASHYREVANLHRRCGVYTKTAFIARILDAVGWAVEADLSEAKLLEPAAGNGAFVVEACIRLIGSFRRQKVPLRLAMLSDRIKAFELHAPAVRQARKRICLALTSSGVHPKTADACAKRWVAHRDFLVAPLSDGEFTHAVGNPPYVRWSRIPGGLRARYEKALSPDVTGGDLFLPFLDRSLRALGAGGTCGFLCSNRWRYMAFAEEFRQHWIPLLEILREETVSATDAFEKAVHSYPSILVARVRSAPRLPRRSLQPIGQTLKDMGCTIKVGPALGVTSAFVLEAKEDDVEAELLHPWIMATEVGEGALHWSGRHVIRMYEADGALLKISHYPRLARRLRRHKEQLQARAIVRAGAAWYRPIDRFKLADWARPKILVPELARKPRCAIDLTGSVPSHGVYAIFAADDSVHLLYERLRDGRLEAALREIAPRVNGDYLRCYRRFLCMMRLPKN